MGAIQTYFPFVELHTIDDVLGVLGTRCSRCEELGWYGSLKDVEKVGNYAKYTCSFISSDYYTIRVDFETPARKISSLENEMQELLQNRPERSAPKGNRENFRKDATVLNRRLKILADFAPASLVMKIDAYCPLCLNDHEVLIRNREVFDLCEKCGLYLGDFS